MDISKAEEEIIIQCKRSFLFLNSEIWEKKGENNFDVTMGSFDGAETCELIGLYLLSKIQFRNINPGQYRDDGIISTTLSPRCAQKICEKIVKIFKEHGL